VDRNLGTLGYRGAELLDKLMHGKPPPTEPIRIPPTGLIARKSSDLLAVNHPGVARSLRFLWDNCHRPMTCCPRNRSNFTPSKSSVN
jgi:LacI family transcriptional regulator